ncbi:MAG: peptide-methionine (S)-S-oxide reductase [Parcubacteria group bacterium RIFCSPHIGHO2_01_FULL_47_10b]|nr:MAG: peptide-methionine (S)-S-oxide reductase [Parcubacteria group bacterium RIFCSPHIGHO2_01_FULL_47_10b]
MASQSLKQAARRDTHEKAYFGGGCFWCTEAVFKALKGVCAVMPGYAGGSSASPTYQQVSSGVTGHAEVIEIAFDPSIISYEGLLDVFWHTHSPTTPNQQGADIGSQYRSLILATSEQQERQATEAKQKLAASGEFTKPIITEVKRFETFHPAEDYHRDYYANNPSQAYCQLVITPKMKKFHERYKALSM